MPEIPLSPEQRIARAGQVDKFTLGYEESARIVIFKNPTFAWVHQLRAPKIVDGRPVMVTKQRKAKGGGDGDSYDTYDMDFIGRPRCLGDYEVIKDKGFDEERCPACRRSQQSPNVKPPERRFAVNVIRYEMTRDGKLKTPFSCTCLVWAFNENTFDKLLRIAEEYAEEGGLLGRDLMCGPCTSATFQNFEVVPGGRSVWKANADVQTRVLETYKGNAVGTVELEDQCGRKVEAGWMAEDLERIAERWRIIDGGGAGRADPVGPAAQAGLAQGLDELLAATPVSPAPAAASAVPVSAPPVPAAPPAVDVADLDGLLDTPAAPAAAPASNGATKVAPEPVPQPVSMATFDDLLASLD